jgi:hypothetical protein
MFNPDPDSDFYPSLIPDLRSLIPDPKTAKKRVGEKKFVVMPFRKKKILASFQRILELFTQKFVTKL